MKAASDQFAKVHISILDSSIAKDYKLRHFFEDMLKLADWRTGIVDMTTEAIGRRLNMPESEVLKFIPRLEKPDDLDKSGVEDGRRIIRLSENRTWGWQIVNFLPYRNIRVASERREYMRQYQAEARAKKKEAAGFKPRKQHPLPGEMDNERRARNGEHLPDPGLQAVNHHRERTTEMAVVPGVGVKVEVTKQRAEEAPQFE